MEPRITIYVPISSYNEPRYDYGQFSHAPKDLGNLLRPFFSQYDDKCAVCMIDSGPEEATPNARCSYNLCKIHISQYRRRVKARHADYSEKVEKCKIRDWICSRCFLPKESCEEKCSIRWGHMIAGFLTRLKELDQWEDIAGEVGYIDKNTDDSALLAKSRDGNFIWLWPFLKHFVRDRVMKYVPTKDLDSCIANKDPEKNCKSSQPRKLRELEECPTGPITCYTAEDRESDPPELPVSPAKQPNPPPPLVSVPVGWYNPSKGSMRKPRARDQLRRVPQKPPAAIKPPVAPQILAKKPTGQVIVAPPAAANGAGPTEKKASEEGPGKSGADTAVAAFPSGENLGITSSQDEVFANVDRGAFAGKENSSQHASQKNAAKSDPAKPTSAGKKKPVPTPEPTPKPGKISVSDLISSDGWLAEIDQGFFAKPSPAVASGNVGVGAEKAPSGSRGSFGKDAPKPAAAFQPQDNRPIAESTGHPAPNAKPAARQPIVPSRGILIKRRPKIAAPKLLSKPTIMPKTKPAVAKTTKGPCPPSKALPTQAPAIHRGAARGSLKRPNTPVAPTKSECHTEKRQKTHPNVACPVQQNTEQGGPSVSLAISGAQAAAVPAQVPDPENKYGFDDLEDNDFLDL